MSLPKQVKEAEENAERLIRAMNPQEPETPTPEPEIKNPEPPKDEPKQPERTDYKAKYLVLQGKYNAEVPRLHAEVKEWKAKAEAAEQALVDAKKQTEEARPAGSDAIDMLREEYGPEFSAAIEQMIDRRAGELVKPLQGKVDETEAERKKSRQQAEFAQRSRDFSDAVNDLVPDWEAIDKLPEFHEFLAGLGGDGRSRQEALMDAAGRFDAAGAARIFTAFKRTDEYQKAHGTKQPSKGKDALASQVVPEMSGRERAPAAGKVWTRAEVTAFYRELALNKIDPDRAKQTERDIEAAFREGRMR